MTLSFSISQFYLLFTKGRLLHPFFFFLQRHTFTLLHFLLLSEIVTELAGYTHRVTQMLDVFDELADGR